MNKIFLRLIDSDDYDMRVGAKNHPDDQAEVVLDFKMDEDTTVRVNTSDTTWLAGGPSDLQLIAHVSLAIANAWDRDARNGQANEYPSDVFRTEAGERVALEVEIPDRRLKREASVPSTEERGQRVSLLELLRSCGDIRLGDIPVSGFRETFSGEKTMLIVELANEDTRYFPNQLVELMPDGSAAVSFDDSAMFILHCSAKRPFTMDDVLASGNAAARA